MEDRQLETNHIVHTGEVLTGRPLYAPRMPQPWQELFPAKEDDLDIGTPPKMAPAVLVGDDAGFCYALEIPTAGAGTAGRK